MNHEYSPIMLGMTYVNLRSKYFANYTSHYFNPDHFETLSKFLKHEAVDPVKYFDFVLGLLDFRKPPTPAKLADPILVQKFRQTVREDDNT